jgi:hypothetical protein
MSYKKLLELAEYGAWQRVLATESKYDALLTRSLNEHVEQDELDHLESNFDIAFAEYSEVKRLIDALNSF